MSLLQISEPGASPDPHQRRVAVGIDLGTTHSLVAAVRHGVAECLPDGEGRVIHQRPGANGEDGDGLRGVGRGLCQVFVRDVDAMREAGGRTLIVIQGIDFHW